MHIETSLHSRAKTLPRNNASPLIIASRGSALALTQSRWVAERLMRVHKDLDVIIEEIRTSGDIKQKQSLQAIGGKGAFTKELEDALLAKRCDIAVHSLKDLPTTLPPGLKIVCTPRREDVSDLLILREKQPVNEMIDDPFALLPKGATVGSSSLRRRAQIMARRPDLKVIEFRGNVDSRLRKLGEGKADAILLALAGVKRLGFFKKGRVQDRFDCFVLTPQHWLPMVGQGALAIEARTFDKRVAKLLAPLHDAGTFAAVSAERAFLRTLNAGCSAPLGAYAQSTESNTLTLRGAIYAPDGSLKIEVSGKGGIDAPDALGNKLARKAIKEGAAKLL
ncbi:MAG: hydroxymethylbilane synthase [Planctomycetes bacterium]|nr:hydroxymethylbilane synthase [Planctomycetota bacterium]